MSFESSIQRIMNGEAVGMAPSIARLVLATAEPLYRMGVRWRNRNFDTGRTPIRALPRPVISVGNLTTGGTGKTPIIRWLAESLRKQGIAVGILSRGYKAAAGQLGDEQRMLQSLLAGGDGPPVEIEADPDRFTAAVRLLGRAPHTQIFLLDDGFQHRQLRRELDIVLLNAREPFGFDHVLPRGLLREPEQSLKRAGVVVITHADALDSVARQNLTDRVRRNYPTGPIYHEHHAAAGLRGGSSSMKLMPMAALASQAAYCFSGLGSPGGFEATIQAAAKRWAGASRFPDHHHYTAPDLERVRRSAIRTGATVLVTTEKDWIKVRDLPQSTDPPGGEPLPIWRLEIQAQFEHEDEGNLFALAQNCLS